MICRKYLIACKFSWVESCFGWKIILLIGKWATCHWLLKCDLKTNTYGIWSYMHSLLQISEFSKHLRDIYEFSWFYSIYFWILVETCSYESLEGFHAIFEIFGFLYEQWSQIGVGFEKIGRIQTCQIFGSADSPRVWGGQSAVHKDCPPEALQRSCQPQKFIADSRQRTADSPPVLGSICQRQFQSGGGVKIQRRTVR